MPDSELWDFSFYMEYSENDIWNLPITHNHFHSLYEIYYLFEGNIAYFIEDKTYYISKGSIVVVPPYKIHVTQCIGEKERKRFWLYVSEDFVFDFLKDEPDLLKRLEVEPFVIPAARRKNIDNLFLKLLNEFQSKNRSAVLLKSLLGEFLVTLWRLSPKDKTNNTPTYDIKKYSKPIFDIVNYISSHYYENITLESLAKKFFLHPVYISRAFKKNLNLSLSDFLKTVRIREAALLLQNSDLSITQIAEKTGFHSPTSFCRTFKTTMMMTPLQYRKSHENKL